MQHAQYYSSSAARKVRRTALVADDHSLFRTGLSMLLMEEFGFAQITEADTLAAAELMLARCPETEVAFFDLLMPGVQGISSLDPLRASYPNTSFVIVSGSENHAHVEQAVVDGFKGFIPKALDASGFVAAVGRVLRGNTFKPDITSWLPPRRQHEYALLSVRQLEVLERLRLGLTNREIAADLKIAGHTVEKQLSELFRIFNVRNRTELAVRICEG